MRWPLTDCDWALLHQRTIYRFDERSRMYSKREFASGQAPDFHFVRTLHGNVWRFHRDLDEASHKALSRLAAREALPLFESLPCPPPERFSAMSRLLEDAVASPIVWRGPLYHFDQEVVTRPHQDKAGAEATEGLRMIAPADIEAVSRLTHAYPNLAAEISQHQPCVAAFVDGDVASVCCSATPPDGPAMEASVQTLPAYRGSRLAGACATRWAEAVSAAGKIPLYSTEWSNRASCSVATRLNLRLYGESLHLTRAGRMGSLQSGR